MDVTIHVGLAKAASTFLQERFFPLVADALYVHAPYVLPKQPNPIQRFARALIARNAACIDLAAVKEEIESFIRASGYERVVVSSEAFFGTPFENNSDFRKNTDLLAEVFGAPKIWLIVRRQDRWLESLYSQVLKMGISTTPERFTNFRDGQFREYQLPVYGGANLDVRDLDWSCYVDYYVRRFGASNVLVQPFEILASDREAFLGRFCAFANLRPFVPEGGGGVNASLSPASASVARVANLLPMPVKIQLKRWIPPHLHPALVLNRMLDPWLKPRRLFPSHLAEAVLSIHREHNRRLEELIGCDLGQHGYY